MKKALLLLALTAASPALARDTVTKVKLADVMALPEAKEKLDGSVKFFLDGAKTPKVLKTLGSDTTNKKTNGVGKSDDYACKWAALSALIALQEGAKKNGANAVVNIVSYYKKVESKSATEIECHAGSFVTGVALKGDYATISK
ncbi:MULTISPECIES: excinuclease ATPase subunit [unclassified Corallococcus]|uniref:excinuclease ATPase subunit n=1 Tax=unclassified Corallococcus TaxID=2685029 RepID=UPI001A8DDAA2|nr:MULTISPECIES: excinuclease ATPase subunit [unclassified Corallococcus]MBN9683532.1 excinuclease ATPase subunit [Corallococcus sp. NCSPR001]WAS84954.1 excinuclease ATPase subunit [Corallococcus sp. NCRR]